MFVDTCTLIHIYFGWGGGKRGGAREVRAQLNFVHWQNYFRSENILRMVNSMKIWILIVESNKIHIDADYWYAHNFWRLHFRHNLHILWLGEWKLFGIAFLYIFIWIWFLVGVSYISGLSWSLSTQRVFWPKQFSRN